MQIIKDVTKILSDKTVAQIKTKTKTVDLRLIVTLRLHLFHKMYLKQKQSDWTIVWIIWSNWYILNIVSDINGIKK